MMMANALKVTGDVEQSERVLVAIEETVEQMRLAQGSGWSFGIEPAQIAAIRGNNDLAIELLSDAIEDGWTFYAAAIFIDSKFDHLREPGLDIGVLRRNGASNSARDAAGKLQMSHEHVIVIL